MRNVLKVVIGDFQVVSRDRISCGIQVSEMDQDTERKGAKFYIQPSDGVTASGESQNKKTQISRGLTRELLVAILAKRMLGRDSASVDKGSEALDDFSSGSEKGKIANLTVGMGKSETPHKPEGGYLGGLFRLVVSSGK